MRSTRGIIKLFMVVALNCIDVSYVAAQTVVTPVPVPAPMPTAPVSSVQSVVPINTLTLPQIQALVAPVALYPDGLLSQMLLAAVFPVDLAQANMMQPSYAQMLPNQAEEAIRYQPWDPTVKSLLSIPQVLFMMATHPDWTRQLGDLYRTRPVELMKAIQNLRQQALKNGSLKSTPQIQVAVDGQGQITINPVNPQIVYVPQYNPTIVYGGWAYPAYPPYPIYNSGWGPVVFGVGIVAGAMIWATPRWGSGVVIVNQPVYGKFYSRYGYPGTYTRPGPYSHPVPAPARGWNGGSGVHGGGGHGGWKH